MNASLRSAPSTCASCVRSIGNPYQSLDEVSKMFNIRKIQEQVLFHAVEEESDQDTATTIVRGDPTRSEDDATWVTSTMKRLERRFDRPTLKRLRMQCQCGYGMEEKLAFVRALVASSSSLQQFADQPEARAAGLSCIDGTLYLQFPSCPCPMLAQVTRLETNTWCQCTTGYSKVLFEQAFGCEVEVELLRSIKMGDDICLMKILPLGTVWRSEP